MMNNKLVSYNAWLCMIIMFGISIVFGQLFPPQAYPPPPPGPLLRQEAVTCTRPGTRCYNRRITCPRQCPTRLSKTDTACYIDCNALYCTGECRYRRPNCKGIGAACFDPRFIGADGAVFYFHGRSNQHFALVSDETLHINARFIGHRPAGRPRDYTWIQALCILFGTHRLTVEATKVSTWDSSIDHLRVTFDDTEVALPLGDLSSWESEQGNLRLERVSNVNSVVITIPDLVEVRVNVVPITKEDDRVHNYQIPPNDCFSHLEVQFKFFGLSPRVEGVLGRTYAPGYESTTRLGIAMPVVGGEDRYRTTSLFAADCKGCVFGGEKIIEPVMGRME